MKGDFDHLCSMVMAMQVPKSIQHLADEISCTERTVYRTIAGLEDMGFLIHKSKEVNPRRFHIVEASPDLKEKVIQLFLTV